MNGIFKSRVERAQQELAARGFDAVVATTSSNFFYFTGVWIDPHERLLACVVRREGGPVMIAPKLHVEDFTDDLVEKLFWEDGTDAVQLLSDCLPSTGTVCIDGNWPTANFLSMLKFKPNLQYQNSDLILATLRRIKDEYEINLLRQSSALADKVVDEFIRQVRSGLTEEQLVEILQSLWRVAGVRKLSFDALIAAGPNGAKPHHQSGSTVVGSGDFVVIDTGGIFNHYCSDMTRTVAVGKPTAEMKEVYEIVRQAQKAGEQSAKPGVPLGEIDRVTRGVIEKAGYGGYFIHRTGHGIGIDVHESPFLYGQNSELIERGMVFSIEPGIYLPGKFGVRIENLVVVTADCCKSLNQLSTDLVTF